MAIIQFLDLHKVIQDLFSEWQTLAMMIREDKPSQGDSVLVDIFGDQVDNWLGLLAEAGAAIATPTTNKREAALNLATCHTHCNDICFRYIDLISYERMQSFVAFGREQGGEWQTWVQAIKGALEASQESLFQLDSTLLEAWKRLILTSNNKPIRSQRSHSENARGF